MDITLCYPKNCVPPPPEDAPIVAAARIKQFNASVKIDEEAKQVSAVDFAGQTHTFHYETIPESHIDMVDK